MFYPYKEVEAAAKQNPPPPPPEDEFPTVATVTALYLAWLIFFSKKFNSPDVLPNAKETISRVSESKLISQLRYRWRMAYGEPTQTELAHLNKSQASTKRTTPETSKEVYVALAWDSYRKNIWNTVSGTCAETVAKSELGKLSPDSLIRWLPSIAHEQDLIHMKEYFKVMTVSEANDKELCIRIGCKCGWSRINSPV